MKYKYVKNTNNPNEQGVAFSSGQIIEMRNELLRQFQPSVSDDEGRTPETCLRRIYWWNLTSSQFELAKSIAEKIWKGAEAATHHGANYREHTIDEEEFYCLRYLEWVSQGKKSS